MVIDNVVIMRDNIPMANTVVNQGKGPQPKLDRNEELKRDYLGGMETAAMVGKYQITAKRIYDILHKMGIVPARYTKKPKKVRAETT